MAASERRRALRITVRRLACFLAFAAFLAAGCAPPAPARIILPPAPLPSERHAAEELQCYLTQVYGRLPCEIRLVPRSDLGRDGIAIRTEGGALVLEGDRPRGLLYAAYELLDRLGVRWYTRDVAVIPRRSTLPSFNLRYTPSLEYREDFYTEAFDADWAARQRQNGGFQSRLDDRRGGKLDYYPFVHTFDAILPLARFAGEHPEFYSEVAGKRVAHWPTQLCLTNPEVLKRTVEVVRGWIHDHPEASIYSISQNDCGNPCQCAACRAVNEREGSPSGSLLTFVNQVAEQFPDKLFDTLAYQYSRKPPRTVRPRENVRVRLCDIECCFAHPLDECPKNRRFTEDLVGWSGITGNLYVWDYVTNFRWYLQPFPDLDVLGPNVRFFVGHGVRGLFEEGNGSPGGGGEFSELRAYVVAKLLWNPNADVPKLVEEFTDAVYAEGAPFVRRYLALLRDRRTHAGIFDTPDALYLRGDFVRRADALFDQAVAAARDPVVKARLCKLRLCIDFLKWKTPGQCRFFAETCRECGITQISEGVPIEVLEKPSRPEP